MKANSETNCDNHSDEDKDETISFMSFEDPVSFNDNIEQSTDFWRAVLPKYVPHPPPMTAVGAELVATEQNSLVVYNPPRGYTGHTKCI